MSSDGFAMEWVGIVTSSEMKGRRKEGDERKEKEGDERKEKGRR